MVEFLLTLSTFSTLPLLGFGFLIGLKHAVEADHLAAVSTIVIERESLLGSALIGGLWGLGHTISLLLAGILVLLLNFQISDRAAKVMEFGVGIMLFLVGLNVLRRLARGGHLHFHTHVHGGRLHTHPHIHGASDIDPAHTHHRFSSSPRAVLIGMFHGLAGSAALMLLVIPTIESRTIGLIYILVFGIGSIGGMMLMSFLVGLPFKLTARRFKRFNHLLQGVAGLASIGLGLWIVYEKGFSEGPFT